MHITMSETCEAVSANPPENFSSENVNKDLDSQDLNGNCQIPDDEMNFQERDGILSAEVSDESNRNSSNSMTGDPMSMDESDEQNSIGEELSSSSYHLDIDGDLVPINKDTLCGDFDDVLSSRTYTVPTPVNMNLCEITEPVGEFTKLQGNIKEKKYPVLPSISKKSTSGSLSNRSANSMDNMDNEFSETESFVRELTKNQMDFSREKIEMEADFFADHRINTSKVKVTPRTNPLPPIRQTTPLNKHGKR